MRTYDIKPAEMKGVVVSLYKDGEFRRNRTFRTPEGIMEYIDEFMNREDN